MMKALVIPVEGPLFEVELNGSDDLDTLQTAVGGWIEAIPMPRGEWQATAYINEEAKLIGLEPNMRATDFMVPWGDYIAGPFVLAGFDPNTGEHIELPQSVIDHARLIEREAGR